MRGFPLAKISGIEVHVDWSLAIIFILIAASLAVGVFPAWHPGWSTGLAWGTAIAAAVLFFASVLTHELSHALVGRRFGVVIHRITLFVFGGMAQMEHEPERWRAELWMAIVGPLTSLAIGIVCILIARTGLVIHGAGAPENLYDLRNVLAQLDPPRTLLLWLGEVNVVLALFNLVPGFPLDGGRVLRALLWGITGNLRRATRWASGIGQAFAWLLIAAGIAMIIGIPVPLLGAGLVSGIWLAFIGWFLNNAALVSYRQLLTREALHDVGVSRLMLTNFDVVGPEIALDELIEQHLLRGTQRAFPVVSGERLLGMVCQRDMERVPREQRRGTRARDIMQPAAALSAVRPQDDAFEALTLLASRDINQLPVVDGGRIVGLLRREDILRWLALHSGGFSRRLRA